jgi:hypothetical protein
MWANLSHPSRIATSSSDADVELRKAAKCGIQDVPGGERDVEARAGHTAFTLKLANEVLSTIVLRKRKRTSSERETFLSLPLIGTPLSIFASNWLMCAGLASGSRL